MADIAAAAADIVANVEKVIIGKRGAVEHLVVAMLCRGHVLLEDVPGTGKTMLARSLAASLGVEFRRLQCTPDLLPDDVTGVRVFDQRTGEFVFRPGPVFTNVLLADEINRATPRTQSALLEAMQERQVTVDGETRRLTRPFLVLATENPVEFEGTFPLPEAQLDRFLMSLSLGYPTPAEEAALIERLRRDHPVDALHPVLSGEALESLCDAVADVHLDGDLTAYLVGIVAATRVHPHVTLGASPRASLALAAASRALAAVRGRDFVAPDDVKELAPAVLAHRLVLSAEARLRGVEPGSVVAAILDDLPLDLAENR